MNLFKTSTLVLCLGLSACSQFQSQDASTPGAAQADSGKHSWWPFGGTDKADAKAPAEAPKPAEANANAASDKSAGNHWWWPFGGSAAGESAKVEAADKPLPVPSAADNKAWLDQHEAPVRAAVAGSKFKVERRDNALVLTAPVDGSFNPKRPELLLPVTLAPLASVAKVIEKEPQSGVFILGHSDSSGDKATNDKVSQQRAVAIAAIFRLSGLGNDRLRYKGVGSDKPVADNKTKAGRAKNRRVEVMLTPRGNLLPLAQAN
ncbi:OmpA family protein [Pseudomonas sp. QL9]|uniref:OmpA family protein n=1 Tax=Pseudomonas sp. QL9 TaxID=3242725 RepID=UPI00352A2764